MNARTGTWFAGALAIVGALIVIAGIGNGVLAGMPAAVSNATLSQDVTGVDEIDVDVADGQVRVVFDDVDEATLDVVARGRAGDWRLEVHEGTLVVAAPDRWGIADWWTHGSSDAVLTLPVELAGADATFDLGSGDLSIDGDFGDVGIDVGSGSLSFDGSTGSLEIEVSAGRAEVDASVDGDVGVEVSAGSLDATIAGDAHAIAVDVAAGSARLEVPAGPYAVSVDAAAGEPRVDVTEDPNAVSTIDVELSAGSVEIVESD